LYVGSLNGASSDVQRDTLEMLRQLPEAGADKRHALGCYTFATLNQASLSDVAVVSVSAGTRLEEALHVVMMSSSSQIEDEGTLAVSHPNLLVSLGEGASLTLVQQYLGLPGSYFVNAVSRFALGHGSSLRHSYLQEQSSESMHIDSVIVDVGDGAVYENQLLASGGSTSRVNMLVSLHEGSSTSLQGVTLATDRQLSDLHTKVTHLAPNAVSKQEHRNVLADRARAVFKGTIDVPKGSGNTTSDQLCRSLLLSDRCKVDISPCLQIRTDEVECAHGATITDLDDEMILYLQARGISQLEARSLLLKGWVRSVVDRVPLPSVLKRAQERVAQVAAMSDVSVDIGSLSSI
jgi:Fe-S cluster assembly protein SufD